MKAALIGLPFSGKSTVFQVLTAVEQGKKEETMGTIKVPDDRIDRLSEIYNPKKTTFAEFVLSDFSVPSGKDTVIPAAVKNGIQKSELLILILRNMDSVMTSDSTDPLREYTQLIDELIVTDLITIEKRIEKNRKERNNLPELPVLEKLQAILEAGTLPLKGSLNDDELSHIASYNFLSLKQRIILLNQPEDTITPESALIESLSLHGDAIFPLSATLELEMNELSDEDREAFLADYGLKGSARNRFIQAAYSALGLISFLTAGEDEVRAWPIKKGIEALYAAGKIHSDIQRGFIRAEIISFEDFSSLESESACRKAGKYRLEGKTYIMQDGDIVNFRFNV
ncbi:DUF933 domain-containing protein [bacterium]|nr:DUF933 domain-containing protein [bacterium]